MAKLKKVIKTKNRSKDELLAAMAHKEKVNREKTLCKLIWPLIENQKSIYDAQTAVQALSGFIAFEIKKKIEEVEQTNVGMFNIDLSQEESSEIKTAIINILGLVSLEKAKDTVNLLERLGNTLAQYSAHQYLKNPMSALKVEDIIA